MLHILWHLRQFRPSLQRRVLGIHREAPWLAAVAGDLRLAREGALHDEAGSGLKRYVISIRCI